MKFFKGYSVVGDSEYSAEIIINNLKTGINKRGELVLHFDTINHKYLAVDKNGSTSERVTEWKGEGKAPMSTILRFVHEPYESDGGWDVLEIRMEAETDEEAKQIHIFTNLCIIPHKWEYTVVFVDEAEASDETLTPIEII